MGDIPSWIWGVTLSFAGCVVSNFGVNVQKLAHTRLMETGQSDTYATQPLWIVGMALVIVGSVGDLMSFGFAPMSLLAPIGAMTLVVNMMVAPCFLGEKLSTRDVVFTLIIVIGTIICISFGSKEEGAYSIEVLIDLYTHTPFVVFSVFLAIIMSALYFLIHQSEQREKKFLHTAWDTKFQAVAYPAVAGAVAALSVLFAKSSTEVIKQSVKGNNQFNNLFSYVLIVLTLVSLYLQMRWLNAGLLKADALFVVPVYQVFWVVMNVVTGMIYFEDYRTMSWTEMFFFIIGIIVTLFGVYFLTQRSSSSDAAGAAAANKAMDIEAAVLVESEPSSTSSSPSLGPIDANGGSSSANDSGRSTPSGAPSSSSSSSSSATGAPRGSISAAASAAAASGNWSNRRRGPSFLLGFHASVDDTQSAADAPLFTLASGMVPTVYVQNEQFAIINGM